MYLTNAPEIITPSHEERISHAKDPWEKARVRYYSLCRNAEILRQQSVALHGVPLRFQVGSCACKVSSVL
jgi:hypothetical protein